MNDSSVLMSLARVGGPDIFCRARATSLAFKKTFHAVVAELFVGGPRNNRLALAHHRVAQLGKRIRHHLAHDDAGGRLPEFCVQARRHTEYEKPRAHTFQAKAFDERRTGFGLANHQHCLRLRSRNHLDGVGHVYPATRHRGHGSGRSAPLLHGGIERLQTFLAKGVVLVNHRDLIDANGPRMVDGRLDLVGRAGAHIVNRPGTYGSRSDLAPLVLPIWAMPAA